MPATPYPKILAFVEGTMERMFLNNNFHYVDVVTLSNGSGWTVDTICKQIATKFRVKNSNPDRVVVWLDMEKQTCTPLEFRNAIRAKLVEIGVEHEKISICIPNRMTENIILADEVVIQSEFDPTFAYQHEGHNGKSRIKAYYENTGVSYRETYHGVTLLKKIRLNRAAANSECVKLFVDEIDMPCWWFG